MTNILMKLACFIVALVTCCVGHECAIHSRLNVNTRDRHLLGTAFDRNLLKFAQQALDKLEKASSAVAQDEALQLVAFLMNEINKRRNKILDTVKSPEYWLLRGG